MNDGGCGESIGEVVGVNTSPSGVVGGVLEVLELVEYTGWYAYAGGVGDCCSSSVC